MSLEGSANVRVPVSMPTASLPAPATVGSTSASAFSTLQKLYQSKEDIGFWSTLYSQHHIHTRQKYNNLDQLTAAAPNAPSTNSDIKVQGPIKVWQVLTKTTLENPDPSYSQPTSASTLSTSSSSSSSSSSSTQKDNQSLQQYRFERLPIKVQTSSSSSSSSILSPYGQPFSVVFFFTVESTPTTLWYLESAFTQSATVHEHMELMGTFQPNDPNNPMSFYIYETHLLQVDQPTHQDTMINIHVQSPSGTIYAKFSYNFINETETGNGTASTTSIVSTDSTTTTTTPTTPPSQIDMDIKNNNKINNNNSNNNNNNYSNDTISSMAQPNSQDLMMESAQLTLDNSISLSPQAQIVKDLEPGSPISPEYSPRHVEQNLTLNLKDNSTTSSLPLEQSGTQLSIPTLSQSNLEEMENSGDEYDDQEYIAGSNSFVEEPDAGEHFMQATSEFFSKMGYWLYNSRVVQYIARDERVRVKTVFQTDEIWILGICYSLECMSKLSQHTIQHTNHATEPTCSLPETSRSRKLSSLQNSSRPGDSRSNTMIHLGAGIDSKKTREKKLNGTSPRAMTDSDSILTFAGSLDIPDSSLGRPRSRENPERQKEKELAKAKKLAQARERELIKEEKAKEKAKVKEQEKLQKLKAKISNPRFDPSNLREGTKDISEISPGDVKDQTIPFVRTEVIRKSRSIHGYHDDDKLKVGLGLTMPPNESKQSVIRRMRSISILPKASTARDTPVQRKPLQDLQPTLLQERVHQPRSQSVSNISVFSQRSAGSSSLSSHDGNSRRHPTSPTPTSPTSPLSPTKSSMSVHDALSFSPKSAVLSKLSQLNLNQKKLPELPPLGPDEIPDIPISSYQHPNENNIGDTSHNHHAYPSIPVPPIPDSEPIDSASAPPKSSKPGKRRMTISGIFSKDPKPSSGGGLAVLKTLVNASKISLRPKAEDSSVVPRHQSPLSVGSNMGVVSFIPQSAPRDQTSNLKKGGAIKNMQHLIERRLSSNNLQQQQSYVSPTDEPAPLFSNAPAVSPPQSPLLTHLDEQSASGPNPDSQNEEISEIPKPDSNKKNSISSSMTTTSTISSPVLAIEVESPQSTPVINIPPVATSSEYPIEIWHGVIDEENVTPASEYPDLISFADEEEDDRPRRVQYPKPLTEMSLLDEPILMPGPVSPVDLVLLPPLPPESPSETFILLNKGRSSPLVSLDRDLEGSVLISIPFNGDTLSSPTSAENGQEPPFEDTIRTQNKRLFDQLAAFSSENSESISNLRSEWESLYPSKNESARSGHKESSDYVHIPRVNGNNVRALSEESLSEKERERIRKIGNAYVKVKNPNPTFEIVAPQPMTPVQIQSQHLPDDIPRSSSPEFLIELSDAHPPSTPGFQSSMLPKMTMAIPEEISPSSPSPCLSMSMRPLSPLPRPPGYSLPLGSSSKAVLSRALSPNLNDSTVEKEHDTANNENLNTEADSASKKGASPTATLLPSSHSNVTKILPPSSLSSNQTILRSFVSDFQSKFWFTYRKDIARIDPSYYTSDAGWGCMMRTGQSLLAQAFSNIFLGRDWRANSIMSEDSKQKYKTLLGWFADEPERPYSIHNIAKSGMYLDKRVGEWFGPSTVAHALNCPVTVLVPMYNSISYSEILRAATDSRNTSSTKDSNKNESPSNWKPVVILMPSRFGLDKLTESYVGNLKQLFKLPQLLGIAGGRPGRSLYFIANQGSELFYLDPHFVKPRAAQDELSKTPSMSYHCSVIRSMDINEMDPSMMLGFLIQSPKDLADLSARLRNDMEKRYPLFTVSEDVPLNITDDISPGSNSHGLDSLDEAPIVIEMQGIRSQSEVTNEKLNLNIPLTHLQQHIGSSNLVVKASTETDDLMTETPFEDLSDNYLAPRPKREMKRITKTLTTNTVSMTSRDTTTSARNNTVSSYQNQSIPSFEGYDHDEDNLSVHSFDSDFMV
ncbi:Cysteine protease atg4c [Entomortierella beljakovae]|nr:Cysteine protease atg4c [Entomortierella beljakovae]